MSELPDHEAARLRKALEEIQMIAAREWAADETNYEWYGDIAGIAEEVLRDEQIERVARRIAGRESGDFSNEYWDSNPREHPVWIEMARDYLRAAGETPESGETRRG